MQDDLRYLVFLCFWARAAPGRAVPGRLCLPGPGLSCSSTTEITQLSTLETLSGFIWWCFNACRSEPFGIRGFSSTAAVCAGRLTGIFEICTAGCYPHIPQHPSIHYCSEQLLDLGILREAQYVLLDFTAPWGGLKGIFDFQTRPKTIWCKFIKGMTTLQWPTSEEELVWMNFNGWRDNIKKVKGCLKNTVSKVIHGNYFLRSGYILNINNSETPFPGSFWLSSGMRMQCWCSWRWWRRCFDVGCADSVNWHQYSSLFSAFHLKSKDVSEALFTY